MDYYEKCKELYPEKYENMPEPDDRTRQMMNGMGMFFEALWGPNFLDDQQNTKE